MLELKSWEPWEYNGIRFEVRRLRRGDVRTFKKLFSKLAHASKEATFGSSELQVDNEIAMLDVAEAVGYDDVLGIIENNVRLVDQITMDGEPITTRSIADGDFLFMMSAVLRIDKMSRLSAQEGKGSPSLSGSPAGQAQEETTSSDSPAPSTASEASPAP